MGEESKDYKEIRPKDWLDEILTKGITVGASDIHIEPSREKARVRFRIDGVLHDVESVPLGYLSPVISSLKVMANLNITEARKPQDGHIVFKPKGLTMPEPIDLRLSIFPSVFGEVAVMRVLNRKDLLFEELEKLGIDAVNIEKLKYIFNQPSGMMLVTGPSGSGKTTTLYTVINVLRSPQINIITLEDPVELYLQNIRQCQIHPEVGFGFADGLRSILRQDPNVVMVGEIRDNETAEISIRATLSGILFLSSMHTNNSIGAVIRLIELGIPRSLVAFALRVIITQRLIRTICPHCKTAASPSPKIIEMSGIDKSKEWKFFQGKGCDACSGTGYRGRSGIFEMMFITKEIQEYIIEGASYKKMEEQAKKNGMKTLREAAIAKVIEGETTLEEAIRAMPF